MSFLFGGGQTPSISMPPSPPIVSDANQDAIKEQEKKKIRRGAAQSKTLLTGPQGLLEPAPVQRKTLLGA